MSRDLLLFWPVPSHLVDSTGHWVYRNCGSTAGRPTRRVCTHQNTMTSYILVSLCQNTMPLYCPTSVTEGSLGMRMGLVGPQVLLDLRTLTIHPPIPGHCRRMVGVPELLENSVRHLLASVPFGYCLVAKLQGFYLPHW